MRVREEELTPVSPPAFSCVSRLRTSVFCLRLCVQLLVALAQQPERIVVASEPDVQPVLLDTSRRAAAGRALAAQPPADLIDGDVISALVPGPGQFKSRRNRRAAAAYDRDLYGLSVSH